MHGFDFTGIPQLRTCTDALSTGWNQFHTMSLCDAPHPHPPSPVPRAPIFAQACCSLPLQACRPSWLPAGSLAAMHTLVTNASIDAPPAYKHTLVTSELGLMCAQLVEGPHPLTAQASAWPATETALGRIYNLPASDQLGCGKAPSRASPRATHAPPALPDLPGSPRCVTTGGCKPPAATGPLHVP